MVSGDLSMRMKDFVALCPLAHWHPAIHPSRERQLALFTCTRLCIEDGKSAAVQGKTVKGT